MTPSSAISKRFTAISFACLCLLLPPWGASLLAEEEAPAQAQDKVAPAGTGREAARATSSQPDSTPVPKPSPTPRAPRPPEKRVGAPAKPALPAQTPAPALSFTDFDLEKYHKPSPQTEEGEAEELATPLPPVPPAPAPPAGTAPAAPPVKAPKARPRPKPVVEASTEDPLKPFRDRETGEKIRQMQIDTNRDRIAKLQARLDYLNAKKNALQNPAPVLQGQTRGQSAPPTPIQGPGKVAIGGFFPPIPPPQTDEDKENDKKLKVKDLLEQVDNEIKSVEEELETAKDELASVETRFAGGTQSR